MFCVLGAAGGSASGAAGGAGGAGDGGGAASASGGAGRSGHYQAPGRGRRGRGIDNQFKFYWNTFNYINGRQELMGSWTAFRV